MLLRVTIVGPSAPREFAVDLAATGERLPVGLGGTPVNGLVHALLERGHFVHLVTSSPDIDHAMDFASDRMSLSVVPHRHRARDRALTFFRSERRELRRAIKSVPTDVIHAHWTYEFAWAALGLGRPLVVTAHDSPLTILRSLPDPYRLIRTLMAMRVRLGIRELTVVSPYLATKWRRHFLYRRAIDVVPNPAPFAIRRGEDKLDCPPVFTDIANSSPLKNICTLLLAFADFRLSHPNAELRLIGDGLEQGEKLEQVARLRGIASGVSFLGPQSRDEVAVHLAESTALIHPAVEESQGMCFLEAMALGVPVVGGVNAGGVPWTLQDGEAGLLVDVRSFRALSEAMKTLTHEQEIRHKLRESGWSAIADVFSREAVSEAYLSAYRRAMLAHGSYLQSRVLGKKGKK